MLARSTFRELKQNSEQSKYSFGAAMLPPKSRQLEAFPVKVRDAPGCFEDHYVTMESGKRNDLSSSLWDRNGQVSPRCEVVMVVAGGSAAPGSGATET